MSLNGPVLSIQPAVSLNIAHPSPVVSPPPSPPSPLTVMQSSPTTFTTAKDVPLEGNHLLGLPIHRERANSEGDLDVHGVSVPKTKPPSPLAGQNVCFVMIL